MKTFAALFAALALGLGAPAGHAQAPLTANPDPAAVKSGLYAVEPNHTRVLFSVSHLGFTDYFGQFNGASGQLELDAAHPAASTVSVSIPTASVATSNSVLDGELKGDKWLDAQAFPAMTFKSTSVTPTGPATADVTGDLTLHGVTRPVTLKVKFNAAGPNPMSKAYTVGFNAVGQIRRSDFGVDAYVPLVGDDVSITISAAFERAP